MTSFIICAHGELAHEFKNSAEMIFGSVKDVYPISFHPGENTVDLKNKIEAVINDNHLEETLIFTDIFGGSPYNASAMIAMENDSIDVVAGVNLALILETVAMASMNLSDLIQNIDNIAPETIKVFSEVRKNIEEEDDLE